MGEANVICIKWGSAFGPEYVNRLRAGVRRNITGDLRFFCITDDRAGIDPEVEVIDLTPEPFQAELEAGRIAAARSGPIQKITLRRPGLIPDLRGPLLSLDLDVVVTGPLDDLIAYAPGKVCMRKVWGKPSRYAGLGNSSAVRYDPTLHSYLYERMAANPEEEIIRNSGSEQSYLSWAAHEAGDFEPFPDAWIASFKYDCRPMRPLNLFVEPHLPDDARIVCFHGRPKMSEAVDGYRSDPLHSTRPCSWLRKNWIGPE